MHLSPEPECGRSERVGVPVRDQPDLIDNLLVRIHFIVVMIRWTGLAPWEFEYPFPGSLTSTFLSGDGRCAAERSLDVRRALVHRAGVREAFSSSVLLSSLGLSDTKVYAPEIRALLGTASHVCLRYRAKGKHLSRF